MRNIAVLFVLIGAAGPCLAADPVSRTPPPMMVRRMVRIAELEIAPAHRNAYRALLAEEQEASVRLEPGVLMLHSVAIADAPDKVRLLEVYASPAAYQAHIRTPHFLKYQRATERMVVSLKLIDTVPILLCAKGQTANGHPAPCL